MNITPVVFRRYNDGGDIVALFPTEAYSKLSPQYVNSYMHVGQHAAGDYAGTIGVTTPATPEQYADLKSELDNIGYNLRVYRRWNRRWARAYKAAS